MPREGAQLVELGGVGGRRPWRSPIGGARWPGRDVFGESAMVGDERWAGSYGVHADFIARDNCRRPPPTHPPHTQLECVQSR